MAPSQVTNVFITVYFNGYVDETATDGIVFRCQNYELIKLKSNFKLAQVVRAIENKITPDHTKRVATLTYRYPLSSYGGQPIYGGLKLSSDDEVEVLMDHYKENRQLGPHTPQVYAELVDAPAPMTEVTPNYSTPYLSQQYAHLSQPSQTPYTPIHPQNYPSPSQTPYTPIHPENYPSSSQTNMHYHGAPSSSNTPFDLNTTNPPETQQGTFRMHAGVHNEDVGDTSEDEDELLSHDEIPNQPNQGTPNIGVRFREHVPHFMNITEPTPEPHDEYGHAMDRNEPYDNPNDLRIGMKFQSREMAQHFIQTWSINNSVEYKHKETKKKTWTIVCVNENCLWRCVVRVCSKDGFWTINQLTQPHTCTTTTISNDHRQLTSAYISNRILDLVREDPGISISVLIAHIKEHFTYQTTYRKTWIAKQKAIKTIYGDWELSYHDVNKWLHAFMQYIPGTYCDYEYTHFWENGQISASKGVFLRIFWSFGPCIEGFKYCKPIVSIDGTWLYGKYRHVLLMAIAQDGNNQCFPIAYALVEGETRDAWYFFLSRLKQFVTPQSGLCLISDRHESIKSAVRDLGADWKHVFCIRHIAQNFMKKFKCTEARKALTNMAYAMNSQSADYWKQKMWQFTSDAAVAWVDEIDQTQLMLHLDNGLRWGHMTTNLAECINNVFKGVRNLPVTSLIENTYCRMSALFVKRGTQADATLRGGTFFAEKVMQKIHRNIEASKSHKVQIQSRNQQVFRVEESIRPRNQPARIYTVDLRAKRCHCGEFQALHFPCSHVIAACTKCNIDHMVHVSNIYRMDHVFKTYEVEFPPLPDVTYWPNYNDLELQHDPELRRFKKGRPVSTRIHTEMDDQRESGKRTKLCSLCRVSGHNKNNCPNRSFE